jgi:hypothetical protein
MALNPSYALGIVRKGQALAMLGRLDLAVDTLEKAIAKDPKNEILADALKVMRVCVCVCCVCVCVCVCVRFCI